MRRNDNRDINRDNRDNDDIVDDHLPRLLDQPGDIARRHDDLSPTATATCHHNVARWGRSRRWRHDLDNLDDARCDDERSRDDRGHDDGGTDRDNYGDATGDKYGANRLYAYRHHPKNRDTGAAAEAGAGLARLAGLTATDGADGGALPDPRPPWRVLPGPLPRGRGRIRIAVDSRFLPEEEQVKLETTLPYMPQSETEEPSPEPEPQPEPEGGGDDEDEEDEAG